MSDTLALFGRAERERLRRFVIAWEKRLALDRKHVATLRARLEAAARVSDEAIPADLVTLHSQVRVRDIESGRAFYWTVVLPSDEDILTTARSPSSWSGATLLGRRVGDEFEWSTRGGSRRVRIEEVIYQPKGMVGFRQRVAGLHQPGGEAGQCAVDHKQSRSLGERTSRHRAVERSLVGSKEAQI